VMINGEESPTFKTGKGLKKEDPLSPLLFNIVIDVLTKMLDKTTERGLTVGLLGQLRPRGMTSL
jgi:hypothetical protein